MASTLSVILICHNEAELLADTLRAVRFADEIVVVDSGSTDGTVEIARSLADEVHVTSDWPGFGKQKNRALEHATSDWVLSIDSDEMVTEALRDEVLAAIGQGDHLAYRMPRLSMFLGREVRHSGWWPDYVLRVFRRGDARFSDDLVHERVVYDGPVGTLREPLRHLSYRSMEEVRAKMERYAQAAAESLHAKGRRGGPVIAAVKSSTAFLRNFVLRRGFLDGRAGWGVAVSAAKGKWRRYMILAALNRGERQ
ncbi:MAG: glycosyltransferase family 2 protein [Pirellulaceae bacterium]|jgi:glycosyltransferase involved in cell wall biosynthesis|nr:glycosyltransferase family 2 protein [Pirellulaceae bacterium]